MSDPLNSIQYPVLTVPSRTFTFIDLSAPVSCTNHNIGQHCEVRFCEMWISIRAVDRILKSRIKSDLYDFLTGRKPLLLWSF